MTLLDLLGLPLVRPVVCGLAAAAVLGAAVAVGAGVVAVGVARRIGGAS